MTNEFSAEQLLHEQRELNKKLLAIQKRAPSVITSSTENQSPANEPVYDLYWQDDTLFLELELPGVSEDDIMVDLNPNYLKINARVTETIKNETAEILVGKRRQGPSEYLFNLPTPQMKTPKPPQLKNGVLFIQLHVGDDTEAVR